MKVNEKKKSKTELVKSKTDEELKQIAKDMWSGKIFSDRHISGASEDPKMVTTIFMPLLFLNKEQVKDLQDSKVNFVYEYLAHATPTAVNGYPTFMTVRFLLAHETEKMLKYYEEFKQLVEKF